MDTLWSQGGLRSSERRLNRFPALLDGGKRREILLKKSSVIGQKNYKCLRIRFHPVPQTVDRTYCKPVSLTLPHASL